MKRTKQLVPVHQIDSQDPDLLTWKLTQRHSWELAAAPFSQLRDIPAFEKIYDVYFMDKYIVE